MRETITERCTSNADGRSLTSGTRVKCSDFFYPFSFSFCSVDWVVIEVNYEGFVWEVLPLNSVSS